MKITYYDNNKCLPTFSISSFFVYVLLALKVLPSLQAKKHKKKKANQFLKFYKLKTFATWNPMD